MEKITELSKEIYSFLGEGYGFNGSEEQALSVINEKVTTIAKYYSSLGFLAGRSEQTWESFTFEHFED